MLNYTKIEFIRYLLENFGSGGLSEWQITFLIWPLYPQTEESYEAKTEKALFW